MNDIVGSGGIEGAMEEYLRGTRGQKTVYIDSEGNATEEYTVAPKQGDTIITTIDPALQKLLRLLLNEELNPSLL